MTDPMPTPIRWGDPERKLLSEMIGQPSLFYWQGPQTQRLVERFRQHYPFEYVFPCSSGTAAVHIAVMAAGIAPGDEIIVPPITDMGTLIGPLYQLAVPVFADVHPHTYNLEVESVRRRITPRTKAIIAVHLAGNPCDLTALRALADEHGLLLIEDCAQAWGARHRGRPVGLFGHIACYSLNDFKHIGCGDGGLVASNDERFGPLFQKSGDKAYDRTAGTKMPVFLAPNYRISEPQSAVGAAQMDRMEEITRRRSDLGRHFNARLAGIPQLAPHAVAPDDHCTFWFTMFRLRPETLRCERREWLEAAKAEGLPLVEGYIAAPVYKYPVFQNQNFFAGQWPVRALGLTQIDYRETRCLVAEEILKTCIICPINQAMDEGYLDRVADGIDKVCRHFAK